MVYFLSLLPRSYLLATTTADLDKIGKTINSTIFATILYFSTSAKLERINAISVAALSKSQSASSNKANVQPMCSLRIRDIYLKPLLRI
jgi:hypothetical protein